jgi:hypothetical protein
VRWLLILGLVAIALWALHRLATMAEERGLIYYRQRPPRVQSLGFLEELVQPSIEYTIEERSSEAIRADHAESGQGDGDRDGDGTG